MVQHVVSQLADKYAHLSGRLIAIHQKIESIIEAEKELPELHQQADDLDQLLVHIEASIRTFDASWSPDLINPIEPRVERSPFGHGELVRIAQAILRATGEALTTKELVQRVCDQKQIEPDEVTMGVLNSTLHMSLKHRQAKGILQAEGWRPVRWSLKRSKV